MEITNEDAENVLLSVCDDGWNGAGNQAEVNAFSQVLEGSILVGDNASLSLSLSEGSTFTGSISGEITNSRGETVSTQVGEVSVTLDGDSTWTLTGDSCVTSFTGDAAGGDFRRLHPLCRRRGPGRHPLNIFQNRLRRSQELFHSGCAGFCALALPVRLQKGAYFSAADRDTMLNTANSQEE